MDNLSHIISNDLSDDTDLKAKSRQMYAKNNTLRHKFHMCSTGVKVKLFTAYFSNVYMCALWVNYRKTHVSSICSRILNRLPKKCSASGMFATDNVNSCTCVIRKSIYSLKPSLVLLNRASYGRRRNNAVTSQELEVTMMLRHNLRTDAQI